MKIVLLLGSPNRQGSSRMLAESFRQGAEEAGHTVELIDAAHSNIHPCTGCIRCGYEGPCSQKDDVDAIRAKISGGGYDGFRDAPLLLRHVRATQSDGGSILRL